MEGFRSVPIRFQFKKRQHSQLAFVHLLTQFKAIEAQIPLMIINQVQFYDIEVPADNNQ